MLVFRALISFGLIAMGIYIIVRMLHYPFAQSFTGIVLGGAMIALGFVRLRQIRAVWGAK